MATKIVGKLKLAFLQLLSDLRHIGIVDIVDQCFFASYEEKDKFKPHLAKERQDAAHHVSYLCKLLQVSILRLVQNIRNVRNTTAAEASGMIASHMSKLAYTHGFQVFFCWWCEDKI